MTTGVVLAHDYATQRGGAERVVLKIADAFPGSLMYTTLYEPKLTFPEFAGLDVRPGGLNRVAFLRRHHRLALPLLASAVDAQRVTGELLIASSTGWAHGYQGANYTVVYCHAPARWLYQKDRYLGSHGESSMRGRLRLAAARAALETLSPPLRNWDASAARRADVYLANSTVTQRAISEAYGIDAEVLPPPPALLPDGEERTIPTIAPGYFLCVARLLPYKNVDVIVNAVNDLPDTRLIVVGVGPDLERLTRLAGARVTLLGNVDDAELRWLYRHCTALIAASYEDYGLSPLEAGSFGRPSLVLRDGGFLDTVVEGTTGVFFDSPSSPAISDGIGRVLSHPWNASVIAEHVGSFAAERFIGRLREVASQFVQLDGGPGTI